MLVMHKHNVMPVPYQGRSWLDHAYIATIKTSKKLQSFTAFNHVYRFRRFEQPLSLMLCLGKAQRWTVRLRVVCDYNECGALLRFTSALYGAHQPAE